MSAIRSKIVSGDPSIRAVNCGCEVDTQPLLDLDHSDAVLGRIDEPGHPREANVGDTVDRLEAGHVVLLDLDPAAAEFGHLAADVLHPPACLRLLILGPDAAFADYE